VIASKRALCAANCPPPPQRAPTINPARRAAALALEHGDRPRDVGEQAIADFKALWKVHVLRQVRLRYVKARLPNLAMHVG
jgi:hypothetical protein